MSNFAKRIIPCLDIKNNRVVKGVNFVGLLDAGDPVEISKKYNDEGADEITFLDITASYENRNTMVNIVKNVAKKVFIPLTVGGGIKKLEDIYTLLNVGCDKISINSWAVITPNFINEAAKTFGSQCVVVAIDVKKVKDGSYHVFIKGGREDTGLDALKWAKEVYNRGAGEILLTSMDTDGTKTGFDLDITEQVASSIPIPIIASGGAGKMEHIKDVFIHKASAALAASIFHFRQIDIIQLKKYLKKNNIPMRI